MTPTNGGEAPDAIAPTDILETETIAAVIDSLSRTHPPPSVARG
jgi:hypothetical protein